MTHRDPVSATSSKNEELDDVLRPGGELHLGDFGAPDTRYSRVASYLTEKLGGEHVQDNYGGLLPTMAREIGFVAIEETGRFGTVAGVLRSFRASRPSFVS